MIYWSWQNNYAYKLDKYTFIFRRYQLEMEQRRPGGRLNKKDGLTRYGDSHVKDKTS